MISRKRLSCGVSCDEVVTSANISFLAISSVSPLRHSGPNTDRVATKKNLTEAISRLEYTVKWRRTVDIDNVEAMAADCGAEVSLSIQPLLCFN